MLKNNLRKIKSIILKKTQKNIIKDFLIKKTKNVYKYLSKKVLLYNKEYLKILIL